MKKIAFSFVLLLALTFSTFAEGYINSGGFTQEGIINSGGRSCPQNQTCLVETNQNEYDNPVISAVKDFLDLLF